MSGQQDFFRKPVTGEQLRDTGVARLKQGHAGDWIADAQEKSIAWMKANPDKVLSSDVIHTICPMPGNIHPNAMGAVFRCRSFEPTGEYIKTKRPEGHARVIATYRLRG